MRDDYVAQAAPRPNTLQEPYLTPYLGLRARLSQIWINRWTILLTLVLIRTLIACASLDNDIGSARTHALSACTGVESMGSAMASMPHYLSDGVNELAASGVEKAVNGLMEMLTLSVTGAEELVVFGINLLTSTYVCLITLAISGSLHVSLDLIKDVTGFLNKSLASIGDDFEKGIGDFQDDLNSISGKLNDIPSLFGSDASIPKLDLSQQLSELRDLQLPPEINESLDKLNSSIPTFSEVKEFTDNALRLPFEEIKKLIKESTGNYSFDRTMFPVPEKEQLTFCTDNNGINDFFDKLSDIAHLARKIFIAVLLILAILVCAPMAWREIKRWKTMQERAQLIKDNSRDPVDVVYIASRPYTAGAGMTVGRWFATDRKRVLARWVVAYGTSTPALYVLSLGVAGLLACLCQYILLKAVEKEVPALTNQVEAFAGKVIDSLTNASEQWAHGTNDMITITNNKINSDVFGWVNTSTQGLNDTLNVFVDQMSDALNATFGDTILYDPIKEVLNCLIGLKIAGIQKGLTWVHDNAHVDFPLFPANMYSLGAAASINSSAPGAHFLANPKSSASDEISAAVVKLVNHIQDGIRTEAIISTCIVLIWFIIVFVGLARAAWLFYSGQGSTVYHDSDSVMSESHHPLNSTTVFETKHEESRAPSYERTVSAPLDRGNQYKGAPYTLNPRPFPTVEVTPPDSSPTDEKVGYAGARSVAPATQHPAHARKSSCADLSMTTPAVGANRRGIFEKMGP